MSRAEMKSYDLIQEAKSDLINRVAAYYKEFPDSFKSRDEVNELMDLIMDCCGFWDLEQYEKIVEEWPC